MIVLNHKIMIRIVLFSLLILISGCLNNKPEVYLFSYFMNNGEDGLHLAFSHDGLTWTPVRNNTSILTPTAGQDKLMRDPCIIRGADDQFHMVWTVSWNEKGIGYANSRDLINWSEQEYLPVMEHEPGARNCWAPELYYDDEGEQYVIFWSTTIPGRFPETDSTTRSGNNHRIYYCTTKDFNAYSETRIMYDHGFNVIDATIQQIDDEYVMFLKDETELPSPEKNIRIARSNHVTGPYTPASEPITGNWVEGPTAIYTEMGWIVYFDMYTKHKMGAVSSADTKNWTDISDKINFPEGTRHGTIFKVSQPILDGLTSL